MHITCSTLCFSTLPLDQALHKISSLGFIEAEIALVENWAHINPSEVLRDPVNAARRIRMAQNLIPTALFVGITAEEPDEYRRQLEAVCRLAKMLTVTLITIPTVPVATAVETEVKRLRELSACANQQGITLSIENTVGHLAQDPSVAVALCEAVPGLGLTLDPSHFINGPHQNKDFSNVYPYVQHVQLRDTGTGKNQMQVPIGQGLIEYGKIVTQLSRFGYKRDLTIEIIDGPELNMDVETEVRKLKLLLETLV